MERIIVLALVLVAFMFVTAIATAAISIPKMNTLDKTLSTEKKILMGDPIDGPGPPGRITGADSQIL